MQNASLSGHFFVSKVQLNKSYSMQNERQTEDRGERCEGIETEQEKSRLFMSTRIFLLERKERSIVTRY